MIKFENTEVIGWGHAIRGMRNPMNSWEKSDSGYCLKTLACHSCKWNRKTEVNCKKNIEEHTFVVGKNDLDLMRRLAAGGPVHAKYRRMITVYVDITAPLYWWKEFDTYKVGTVANSCSTMHEIAAKEFMLEDFSCEHLTENEKYASGSIASYSISELEFLNLIISRLNHNRWRYLKTKDKKFWWQMIQLLPSSYNQKRTVMLNYEVLANIYKSRRNHKLDEWAEHTNEEIIKDALNGKFGFCDWIKTLPYSELITQEVRENDQR